MLRGYQRTAGSSSSSMDVEQGAQGHGGRRGGPRGWPATHGTGSGGLDAMPDASERQGVTFQQGLLGKQGGASGGATSTASNAGTLPPETAALRCWRR